MSDNCKHCTKAVVDGVNGTIYPPPPWMPDGSPSEAVCYGCENEQEQAGEDRHQEDQIEAAIRAGRRDLI